MIQFVLLRTKPVFDDERVGGGEVGDGGRVQVAAGVDGGGVVAGVVWAEAATGELARPVAVAVVVVVVAAVVVPAEGVVGVGATNEEGVAVGQGQHSNVVLTVNLSKS